ncbi:MAG TPA: hypothetical protein VFZ90_16555 [Gemmatimonadales bacterium]
MLRPLRRAAALCLLIPPLLLAGARPAEVTPRPQRTGPPIIHGIIHYERRGVSAAPTPGILTAWLVGGAAALASQRALRGFIKAMSLAASLGGKSSLGGASSIKDVNDFMRSTVNVDLSGLPVKAEYGADVSFTLEGDKNGVFQLREGYIKWSVRNNTRLELSKDGNTHIFHDQATGQGSAPLTPDRSSITLRTEGKGKDIRFLLDVDIKHPMPTEGSALWSAMSGLNVLRITEHAGTEQWHMNVLGQQHDDPPHHGLPGDGGFGYYRSGPLDSVASGREVWLNLMDSPERIEYQLFLDCSATIIEPQPDARLVFNSATPARVEKKAKAEARPEPWGPDLRWTLPQVEDSRSQPTGDELSGAELPFSYEGLPRKNSDLGSKNIEAAFGTSRTRGVACTDPEPRPVRFFFSREADNNPLTPRAPNWFQYWKQTPAALGHESAIRYQPKVEACTSATVDEKGVTRQGRDFGYYPWNTFAEYIYVCDLKPAGFKTQLLFGGGSADGIDVFGVTVIHEWRHKTDFETWWKRGYSTRDDPDKDLIPNAEEPKVKPPPFLTGIKNAPAAFDTTKFDTFGYGYGDEHYLAYAEELNWDMGSADREDWSCPGHQAGQRCD